MSDKPKPTLFAAPRAYGKLDTSKELVICRVMEGKLVEASVVRGDIAGYYTAYPKSWEEGVNAVGTREKRAKDLQYLAESRAKWEEWEQLRKAWEEQHGEPPHVDYQRGTTSATGREQWRQYDEFMQGKPPYPEKPFAPRSNDPDPLLMMGLNSERTGYEAVYDPHDIAADIDPMMLLNFRRTL